MLTDAGHATLAAPAEPVVLPALPPGVTAPPAPALVVEPAVWLEAVPAVATPPWPPKAAPAVPAVEVGVPAEPAVSVPVEARLSRSGVPVQPKIARAAKPATARHLVVRCLMDLREQMMGPALRPMRVKPAIDQQIVMRW